MAEARRGRGGTLPLAGGGKGWRCGEILSKGVEFSIGGIQRIPPCSLSCGCQYRR